MTFLNTIIAWITTHYELASVLGAFIYTTIIRLVPTASNWDIWATITKVLDILIPNKAKDGGVH